MLFYLPDVVVHMEPFPMRKLILIAIAVALFLVLALSRLAP